MSMNHHAEQVLAPSGTPKRGPLPRSPRAGFAARRVRVAAVLPVLLMACKDGDANRVLDAMTNADADVAGAADVAASDGTMWGDARAVSDARRGV